MFLNKWPRVYRLAVRLSLFLKPVYLKGLFIGSRAWEKEWENAHLEKRNDWGGPGEDLIKSYRDSTEHPHRVILVENVLKFSPESVLEIGSNCGPNLYLLARRLPAVRLHGIDLNAVAIENAKTWFNEAGISNATMETGRADELGRFPDKSIDVIFTDAVLIFVGPDKIRKVISEMLRVARKGLVFTEFNIFEGKNSGREKQGIRQDGFWKRDYASLLSEYSSVVKVETSRITADIWGDPNWQTAGAFIRVFLKNS